MAKVQKDWPRIEEDLGGCSGSDPCWPETIPAGFAVRGRSASGACEATAKPVPLAGRSDLTAFLSSDIFPDRWLRRLGFGYGAGAVMEDDRWKMADGKWKIAGLTAVTE